MKRYESVVKYYTPILKKAVAEAKHSKEKLFIFTYTEDKMSFTSELSNYITYKHPNKVF